MTVGQWAIMGGGVPLLGLILLAGSEANTKRLLDRKAVKRNN